MVETKAEKKPTKARQPPSSRWKEKQLSEKQSIAKQPPARDFRQSACSDNALKDLVQMRLGINQPTIPIETQQRPPFVASAGDDVFSRQHGRRKAPVLMEVQRQNQIVTAGAGNTIDIAIACQMERADALVGVKPHHRSAKARQAIDLLIR